MEPATIGGTSFCTHSLPLKVLTETGIVGLAEEAQQIATKLKDQRCFQDVRLSKVVQVVNSDRQKYGLEWDVRCPEDEVTKTKKKKTEESGGGSR